MFVHIYYMIRDGVCGYKHDHKQAKDLLHKAYGLLHVAEIHPVVMQIDVKWQLGYLKEIIV